MTGPQHDTNEPATPDRDGGLVRVRIDFAYDGTDFSGWAAQPGRRTVQGVLTEVLKLHGPGGRPPRKLVVAGRTDAGVHADHQVAHLEVLPFGDEDLFSLVARWNRMLPPDVRVQAASRVPVAFDARFSALRRRYAYKVSDLPFGAMPLQRRDTLSWPRPLDGELMNEASQKLLGENDFVAFCRRREGATTIRELQRFEWQRRQGVFTAYVTADAFCHSMVRSLIGAVLAVGEGRLPVDWPGSLLSATTRPSTITVAPAHALTLLGVDYPPDAELAARAERTRNMRQPRLDDSPSSSHS